MRIPTLTLACLLLAAAPCRALAQSDQQSETTVALDLAFGIRPVQPARLTVPAGDLLRFTVALQPEGTRYVWTKNGQPISGAPDSNVFVLPRVQAADAGTYVCQFSTAATSPRPSQAAIVGVGPTDRLLNLSSRGNVGATADTGLTAGFVVAGANSKRIVLRAIGPSLAQFGVANPLRQPVLRIYDGNGRIYDNAYVYLPVVGAPTYESELAAILPRIGAFPVPAGTRDIVEMRPFPPGSYTATVTSGDGTAGAVLLEIYEVP